jgi:hypothetical protein
MEQWAIVVGQSLGNKKEQSQNYHADNKIVATDLEKKTGLILMMHSICESSAFIYLSNSSRTLPQFPLNL